MDRVNQTSKIDNILNETEIGSFIAKNKTLFVVLVTLVVLSVIGYGLYNQQLNKKHDEYGSLIFQFEDKNMKKFIEDKEFRPSFLVELKSLYEKIDNFSGAFPLSLTVIDELINQKDYQASMDVVQLVKRGSISKIPYANYLLSIREAAIYEDLGQLDKAAVVYEELLKSSQKVLENKIYLDLGRIYFALGNTEKAKMNLQYVIDNANGDDFKKIANLYLSQIK